MKKIVLYPVRSLRHSAAVDSLTLSRHWLMLSIGTLILSGIFSVVIVFARTPVIGEWLFDPLFARRGLVVHVDLALLIWLYAFMCAMFVLLPATRNGNRLLPLGYSLGMTGVLLIVCAIFVPSAEPVLSNYIPVLDHPLFISGLILFAAGTGCTISNARLLPPADHSSGSAGSRPSLPFPNSSIPGFRTAGLLLLVAFITFFGAWLGTPSALDAQTYYELTIWGGGHILQFVNVATMLSVWIILLAKLLNRDPFPDRW
ncbi:MAG: hypothetical protein R3224_07705 [Balneolaceae bacterium]|nr:hypothetical protein [Balneolaceae bacterium]